MGYSAAYTFFAGAIEVLAGALVLFRRTTTLGALVATAALLNVGMLDFCYDVPEKLDVIHLFLMAVFLLAPDFVRLANLLILNRPIVPAQVREPPTAKWMRTAKDGVKAAAILYMIVTTPMIALKMRHFYSPRSPLYGIYDVEEFRRNGELLPPLTTDAIRWRKVVFLSESETWLKLMDDSWHPYRTEYDPAANKVTLRPGAWWLTDDRDKTKNVLFYSQPDREVLVLHGTFVNDSLAVKLKRFDESKFELVSSRFRWINGFP